MTNEKLDLIDRKALIAEYDRVHIGPPGGARKLMEDAPTVDAVEVVHGEWEDMWGGKYANPRYRCSVCKEKALYKSVQDELLSWHDVQVLTLYCPYCLAKLDGGIGNDIKAV